MLEHYKKCISYGIKESANKLVSVLCDSPFFGRFVKEKHDENEMKKFKVFSVILKILFEIIKKISIVFFFMYIPYFIFSEFMEGGEAFFTKDACFVYFTIILVCFMDSLLNSKIFEVDEDSYIRLRLLRVKPAVYFKIKLFSRTIKEMVAYTLAFLIFGLRLTDIFFVAILIAFSRYVGETINILVFRVFGANIARLKGMNTSLMLLALFLAYFVPYMRGKMPAFNVYIFESAFIYIFFLVGTMFVLYMLTSVNYEKIISRMYTIENLYNHDRKETKKPEWVNLSVKGFQTNFFKKEYTGKTRFTHLFFERNMRFFRHEGIVKIIAIGIFFLSGMTAVILGKGIAVKNVIDYSLSILPFMMLCLCDTRRVCRYLFANCDRIMLKNENTDDDIINNFFMCLGRIFILNAVPAVVLIIAYIVAGLTISPIVNVMAVVQAIIAVILFYILYTIITFTIYYIFQPYNIEVRKVEYVYSIISAFLYVVSYVIVFIKISNIHMLFIVGILTAVITALSVTSVRIWGAKKFVIKK